MIHSVNCCSAIIVPVVVLLFQLVSCKLPVLIFRKWKHTVRATTKSQYNLIKYLFEPFKEFSRVTQFTITCTKSYFNHSSLHINVINLGFRSYGLVIFINKKDKK